VLKDKVAMKSQRSLQEIEKIASELWDMMPKTLFENLVDSMPRRIEQVIQRNGGKADY